MGRLLNWLLGYWTVYYCNVDYTVDPVTTTWCRHSFYFKSDAEFHLTAIDNAKFMFYNPGIFRNSKVVFKK